MKCAELETCLADYLEGELEPARVDAMLAHLEECPACRAEFQAYQRQEETLGLYFQAKLDRALDEMPNPLLDEPEVVTLPSPQARTLRWVYWAAAAVLMLAVGVGGPLLYHYVVPSGQATLATVKEIRGRALVLKGDRYEPLQVGTKVLQNQKIKVANEGYLALDLPQKGNVLEARGGTKLSLQDTPGRLEVAMNRGSVWAHLPNHPEKPFVVKTAHLSARATGTVYGVEEGLDRSVVTVADGTVQVESANGKTQSAVPAGEGYASNRGVFQLADATAWGWSDYKDEVQKEVAEVVPSLTTQAPVEVAAAAPPQLTVEASVRPAAVAGAASRPAYAIADFLPMTTDYLLLIHDWPSFVSEFKTTGNGAFVQEAAFQAWWASVGGPEVTDQMNKETHFRDALSLLKLISGDIAISVDTSHTVTLVADCTGNEAAVQAGIEKLVSESRPNFPSQAQAETEEASQGPLYQVGNGYFVFSSKPLQTRETHERLAMGQPTGFASSEFYQKIQRDVTDPRFLFASNLQAQVRQVGAENAKKDRNPDVQAMFDLLGLDSLDYFLISPSFAGQGMNQAARLAFGEQGRQGMLNWLAEPAPMRGLDFFSPDAPFFAAAVSRNPYQMLLDYMVYVERTKSSVLLQDLLNFAASNQALFEACGGEVVVGLDVPVLPVPNVKVVVEMTDRAAFQDGVNRIVEELRKEWASRANKQSVLETQVQNGIEIHTLIVNMDENGLVQMQPSWAFVEDYFIVGPGPEFIRNALEVYQSGHTIATDAKRLQPLLPDGSTVNFSLLVYQDIAKTIPKIVEEKIAPKLSDEEKAKVPNLGFMENYRAPGILYAHARPTCVDFHLSTPKGIDLNFMALPLVANWLQPRTDLGRIMANMTTAEKGLKQMRDAALAYAGQYGRLPASLSDLVETTLPQIPLDPFALISNNSLRLIPGPAANQITLYSVGPDGKDDQGAVDYQLTDQAAGQGDITLHVTLGEGTPAGQ